MGTQMRDTSTQVTLLNLCVTIEVRNCETQTDIFGCAFMTHPNVMNGTFSALITILLSKVGHIFPAVLAQANF
jgi:hypothetical protein